MSLRPDGTYRCDRCDTEIGNAGPDRAVTIAGADPFNLRYQRVLHLCIDRTDIVDGEETAIAGCRDRVLTVRALAAYHAHREGTTHEPAS